MVRPKKEGHVLTGAERAKLSRDRKRDKDPEAYKAHVNSLKKESRKRVKDDLSEDERKFRTTQSNARVGTISRIINIWVQLYSNVIYL